MSEPVVCFRAAEFRYGDRVLWSGLDLDIAAGEFVAVLGANGSGKTSLLQAILGLRPLFAGQLTVAGSPPGRGSHRIGYVPQQRRMDPLTPIRARDLVRQGIDGHRWGIGRLGNSRHLVDAALDEVGATAYSDVPIGRLSGGEQQRVRIAQALVSDPPLLLCDEPLLSLDPNSQSAITALVERRRRQHDTAVLFVTHEINPVLPYVDRVLYLAGGRFRVGTVDEVMTSEQLTDLYGGPVEVLRIGERILVSDFSGELAAHSHHLDEDDLDDRHGHDGHDHARHDHGRHGHDDHGDVHDGDDQGGPSGRSMRVASR